MHYKNNLLAAAALVPAIQLSAAETILGAYVFHRHGDRTSKSTPPASLTDLGYQEILGAGTNFHNRYIADGASTQILGIQSETVKLSQLAISSPLDNVLQNSAAGWLQGLYPPVGGASNQTLRNGTVVEAPLNGYQLIPISITTSGSGSENNPWLQSSTSCNNALISSNEFFNSDIYLSYLNSTTDLYKSVAPAVNATFTASQMSFKNAYVIWDLLNVAMIHNSTTAYPALSDVSNETMHELFVLANIHEYNLAYNASSTARAIAGAQLASQVLIALNETVTTNAVDARLNVQFGSYGTFQSYFGLANLPAADPIFYGIPDYASSMVWELVTNATVTNGVLPSTSDISVRFLFNNGTSATSSNLTAYPLFGGSEVELPWTDFVTQTQKFAISSQDQWCQVCGNTTGVCATSTASSSSSSPSASSSSSGSGISNAVAGVIGAMVTLGVILGLEVLAILLGGLRLVKKSSLAASAGAVTESGTAGK
jgi:acid phosphatase